MTTRKQIWDKLDEWEGKKKGSSYKALMKEMGMHKYHYVCADCGKTVDAVNKDMECKKC